MTQEKIIGWVSFIKSGLLFAALVVASTTLNTNSVQAQETKVGVTVGVTTGVTLTPLNWEGPLIKSGNPEAPKGGVRVHGFLPASSGQSYQLLVTMSPYVQTEAQRYSSLWRVDLSGQNAVKILEETGNYIRQVSASPNGKYVAYVLYAGEGSNTSRHVWFATVKAGAKRKLYDGAEPRFRQDFRAFPYQWRADGSLDVELDTHITPAPHADKSFPDRHGVEVPAMQWRHFTRKVLDDFKQGGANANTPSQIATKLFPTTDAALSLDRVPVLSHDGRKTAAFYTPGQLEVSGSTMQWRSPRYERPQVRAEMQWSNDDLYLTVQAQPSSTLAFTKFYVRTTRIFQPETSKQIDVEAKIVSVVAGMRKTTESEFLEGRRVTVESSSWVPGAAHRVFVVASVLPPFQGELLTQPPFDPETHYFFMDVDTGRVTHVDTMPTTYRESSYVAAWSPDGRYVLLLGGTFSLYKVN